MGAIYFKNHLLVFLLISLLAVARPKPLSHWEIHIKNALKNGQRLFVHCKSKDDDLGARTLKSGTEFKWDFKVNIWDTTLFWCYLCKDQQRDECAFDAFWVEKKTEWLRIKCKDLRCFWTAEDRGIFLLDGSRNVDEYLHPWKMIPPYQ
ncbi:S-protein homolog 1-like [Momordica charantia]|uniref:S-protein homolog n=1 Tax=Momordica charantia TaxID=3673 RepID=A0A6J1DJ51_MOMCH|nr:S-protein homolog 1-like [Momordica charantia]